MVVQPRLWSSDMRPRIKRSVIYTNVAVAIMIAVLCFVMGPVEYLLVQAPILFMAGGMGVWLFYVQHQFEDVYWENTDSWSYAEAALQGSSYLKLPKWLQFFTGNIGLHHVHHLSARIPNYNLQRAHDDNPVFHDVPDAHLLGRRQDHAAEAHRRGARPAGHLARGAPAAAPSTAPAPAPSAV